MGFKKFKEFTSTVVPLATENIDTDQIIPARFLKAVERKGFGEKLFHDWRYDEKGNKIASFELNDQRYSGKILLAGKNFGCGSSREHAAWALYDYGFRAIISSYFADIFTNNAFNNGLLPIQVSEDELAVLMKQVADEPDSMIEINLAHQKITITEKKIKYSFEINAYKKECLIQGYDDFSYLQSMLTDIEKYEQSRNTAF
ncbi:MAG: 3-isopropylmalate dehydratase small subunit [Bacteroidetes bacterium]|nr:3-isopropylmalate dehydratase small subunit [Bacteroidota bacterium]